VGAPDTEKPKVQILLGLSDFGQIMHTEMLSVQRPLQLFSLARDRLALFARIEIWEDAVCVLRCPPRLDQTTTN
jgi:hypothetical protein